MSDLTDNEFYPSAERIWLCIRFNNAGEYCDITLKIMIMLQNVCENCIRIFEEEKHRQLRMFVILWEKVKETGILIAKPKREKPKTVHTPKNIAVVAESMYAAPSTSIHCRSQQLNILQTSLRWILHKDLGITPYKVQLVQELKPNDHPMRFRFSKWACDRLIEDAGFGKKSSFQMKLILILAGM